MQRKKSAGPSLGRGPGVGGAGKLSGPRCALSLLDEAGPGEQALRFGAEILEQLRPHSGCRHHAALRDPLAKGCLGLDRSPLLFEGSAEHPQGRGQGPALDTCVAEDRDRLTAQLLGRDGVARGEVHACQVPEVVGDGRVVRIEAAAVDGKGPLEQRFGLGKSRSGSL